MAHHLVRVDADRNVHRFYTLDIQRDLFGTVSLIREWGRIGQAGTVRITTLANVDAAKTDLSAVLARKEKRGYRPPAQAVEAMSIVARSRTKLK